MKTLKFILPVLFLIPISSCVRPNIEDTYLWMTSGCRDHDLNKNSHKTKFMIPNPFLDSKLTLNKDLSAVMTIEVDDADGIKEQNIITGTYVVKKGKVIIRDPKIEMNKPVLILDIVGTKLILDYRRVVAIDGFNVGDLNAVTCDSDKVFVHVFIKKYY